MDEALVEDAEHDVDDQDRGEEQQPEAATATTRTPAPCPGSSVVIVGGQRLRARSSLHAARPPRRARRPGVRLNEIVTAGSWPAWLTVSGPTLAPQLGRRRRAARACRSTSARRAATAPSGRAGTRRASSRITRYWLLRRVDGRDPAVAVGAVERALDLLGGDAERRRLVAVDVDVDLRVLDLQVAGDVLQHAGSARILRLELCGAAGRARCVSGPCSVNW